MSRWEHAIRGRNRHGSSQETFMGVKYIKWKEYTSIYVEVPFNILES